MQSSDSKPKRYQPTLEETKLFRECQSESFWYRAMPLSVSFSVLTSYSIKTGYISSTHRFRKTFGALALGYIIGQASYVNICKDRIIKQFPNSEFSRAYRKLHGEIEPEFEKHSLQIEQEKIDKKLYELKSKKYQPAQDSQPSEMFQYSKDRAGTEGDSAYSDYFASPQTDEAADRSTDSLSYEQLRAHHRQKEAAKLTKQLNQYSQQGSIVKPSMPIGPNEPNVPAAAYSPQPVPAPSDATSSYASSYPPPIVDESQQPALPTTRRRTNKYGDEIFE